MVAIGGDGTASKVVSGLLTATQNRNDVDVRQGFTPARPAMPVGIIPTGWFLSVLLQVTNSSLWMYSIRHSPITLQSCRLVHVLQNSLVWNYCLYWMNLMVPWTHNALILYLLYKWTLDVLNMILCFHEVSIHQEWLISSVWLSIEVYWVVSVNRRLDKRKPSDMDFEKLTVVTSIDSQWQT